MSVQTSGTTADQALAIAKAAPTIAVQDFPGRALRRDDDRDHGRDHDDSDDHRDGHGHDDRKDHKGHGHKDHKDHKDRGHKNKDKDHHHKDHKDHHHKDHHHKDHHHHGGHEHGGHDYSDDSRESRVARQGHDERRDRLPMTPEDEYALYLQQRAAAGYAGHNNGGRRGYNNPPSVDQYGYGYGNNNGYIGNGNSHGYGNDNYGYYYNQDNGRMQLASHPDGRRGHGDRHDRHHDGGSDVHPVVWAFILPFFAVGVYVTAKRGFQYAKKRRGTSLLLRVGAAQGTSEEYVPLRSEEAKN